MSTTAPEQRSRIVEIIKHKSFVRGNITLASGKQSDHYFDLKPTMFDPEAAHLLSRLVLHQLEGVQVDLIGGLEMGAVPLISAVNIASLLEGRPIPGFFVRKAAKDHGTRKLIEGARDLEGKNAVIIEDVTTTGQSAMVAVRAVREAGGAVTLVLAIVDREDGAAELFKREDILFQSLFTSSDFLKS